MTRRENHILTHYTDIAEARQRDIRRQQAEMARTLFRFLGAAIRKAFTRRPGSDRARGVDQV